MRDWTRPWTTASWLEVVRSMVCLWSGDACLRFWSYEDLNAVVHSGCVAGFDAALDVW